MTGPTLHNAPLEDLKIKVNQIDMELDDIQAKMNDSGIDLGGGIRFASRTKFRAWYTTNVGTKHKGKHVGLVDLSALMCIAKGGGGN